MSGPSIVAFSPSHSSRVRGLKLIAGRRRVAAMQVALFTGAWIETIERRRPQCRLLVALFTGAWIETSDSVYRSVCVLSHSSRVRGLKLSEHNVDIVVESVALFTGAWIETRG